MKRKFGLCIILLVLGILAAIFVPWDKLGDLKNRILNVEGSFSSLKVYSLAGEMKIYIDGEEEGLVNANESYTEIFPISPGEHEVMLERVGTTDLFYENFKKKIVFEKGFDVSISWEIGPTPESSSGWVLWAQDSGEELGHATMEIVCVPEDCGVHIDDEIIEDLPITQYQLSLEKQHNINVSKEGYQSLEFTVLPEDEDTRRKIDGYRLFVEVNLYQLPI